MKETHQPRAPTMPRTGRPNREPLDADEVIAYGLALAEDLGVSIPKRKRLRRMLKRRIPIPQIYQGADYRLWNDRYYIAAQSLADESVRYAYLTRIHIRSELLANRNSIRKNGFALLDSEALAEFAAARPPWSAFRRTTPCAFPAPQRAARRGWIWTRHGAARERSPRHRANAAATGQRKSRRAAASQSG